MSSRMTALYRSNFEVYVTQNDYLSNLQLILRFAYSNLNPSKHDRWWQSSLWLFSPNFTSKVARRFGNTLLKRGRLMVKMNPFLLLLAARNILQLICDGLLSTKVFNCHTMDRAFVMYKKCLGHFKNSWDPIRNDFLTWEEARPKMSYKCF